VLVLFLVQQFQTRCTQAIDPRTGDLAPLFDPRTEQWNAHFRWNGDGSKIVPRSPTGRATVHALRLNRPTLVRARRVWGRHGLHPPEV
jgi:hypothetical protein